MEVGLAEPQFKLAAQWLPKLFEKLTELRERRQEEISKIADMFENPLDLARFYVEPDCQQFNPADDDEEEIAYVVREPIFRRLESFLGGPRREGKHQLLLLADAGMGKTSTLVMLTLAHLLSFWPKGYDCILHKCGPDTLDALKAISNRRNMVLLIDALDEDSTAWGRVSERITEILHETFNFRRVIITCRTQFFSADEDPFNRKGQVEVGGFLCPVIYNSLFSEEQIHAYLKKRFGGSRQAEELVERSHEIIRKMGSLKFRPMLLSHIEDLLESEQATWNEYTVYEALVRAWLLREQRKGTGRSSRPSLAELWLACQTLALTLQRGGTREIAEADLLSLIREHPALAHIPAMEIAGRSLLNKNSRGDYRFSHYSIQEFLLVDGSLRGSLEIEKEGIRPTHQMNSFAAAWLLGFKRGNKIPRSLASYDLTGLSLTGAWLVDQDLRHFDLSRVNLRNARLAGAQLQWAKLSESDLRGADLKDAKLHWTNFAGAKYNAATVWPLTGVPDGAVLVAE